MKKMAIKWMLYTTFIIFFSPQFGQHLINFIRVFKQVCLAALEVVTEKKTFCVFETLCQNCLSAVSFRSSPQFEDVGSFFFTHTPTHPHTHHFDVLSHYLIVPRHGIKTTWLTEHFTVYVWTAQKSPWQINESSFIPKSFRAFYLIGKTFWQVEF